MRKFFTTMFQAKGGPNIECFSLLHFMYLILIVGLTIGLAFIIKNKSDKVKKITLNVLAIAAIAVYIADFFIMPLARGGEDIDTDKLPFHFCTFIGIMIPFAQFNKKMKPDSSFKEAVTAIGLATSLMYICYPGSALGGIGAFSYKVVQTFVFHGLVFSWCVISLSTGATKFNFKNIWKPLVGIAAIIVWGWFGNIVWSGTKHSFDWCFVTGSLLPVHPALMTFIVLVAVFGMCAILYSIDLVTRIVAKKIANKKKASEKVDLIENAVIEDNAAEETAE